MEIVGSVSAILAVAEAFDHLFKRLHRCYRRLNYAREDVREIRDEVGQFGRLLCTFHSTVTDERLQDEGLARKINNSDITQHIVQSGRKALHRIDGILIGLDPLRTDRVYPTLQQWYARWKWSKRKEEWSPIHILLISIKSSANLLVSIVICHDLLHKLDQLRAENKPIPHELIQKFSLYASEAKTMMSRCKKTERRMRAQQADVLRMAQEVRALSYALARSHLVSHPELEATLGRKGLASFVSSNSTASTNSGVLDRDLLQVIRRFMKYLQMVQIIHLIL
ncbi:hypothetical protein AYO22_08881 [Fonsecaea multimorphosa]|nr:hypothetical protein AYO22_08881 [Fonsecaea multimorphosa]